LDKFCVVEEQHLVFVVALNHFGCGVAHHYFALVIGDSDRGGNEFLPHLFSCLLLRPLKLLVFPGDNLGFDGGGCQRRLAL